MTKQQKGSARATAERQNAGKTGRHRERYSTVIHLRIDLNREYRISIHQKICSRSIRYFQSMTHQRSSLFVENRFFVRRKRDAAELLSRIRHASKSLLLSDRSATLSFLALWEVASQTIFHFPADMIQVTSKLPEVSLDICHLSVRVHPCCIDESMFQPLSDCSDFCGCASPSQIPS